MDKIKFIVGLEMVERAIKELEEASVDVWYGLTLEEVNDIFQRLNEAEARLSDIYEDGLRTVRRLGEIFCTSEEWKRVLEEIEEENKNLGAED